MFKLTSVALLCTTTAVVAMSSLVLVDAQSVFTTQAKATCPTYAARSPACDQDYSCQSVGNNCQWRCSTADVRAACTNMSFCMSQRQSVFQTSDTSCTIKCSSIKDRVTCWSTDGACAWYSSAGDDTSANGGHCKNVCNTLKDAAACGNSQPSLAADRICDTYDLLRSACPTRCELGITRELCDRLGSGGQCDWDNYEGKCRVRCRSLQQTSCSFEPGCEFKYGQCSRKCDLPALDTRAKCTGNNDCMWVQNELAAPGKCVKACRAIQIPSPYSWENRSNCVQNPDNNLCGGVYTCAVYNCSLQVGGKDNCEQGTQYGCRWLPKLNSDGVTYSRMLGDCVSRNFDCASSYSESGKCPERFPGGAPACELKASSSCRKVQCGNYTAVGPIACAMFGCEWTTHGTVKECVEPCRVQPTYVPYPESLFTELSTCHNTSYCRVLDTGGMYGQECVTKDCEHLKTGAGCRSSDNCIWTNNMCKPACGQARNKTACDALPHCEFMNSSLSGVYCSAKCETLEMEDCMLSGENSGCHWYGGFNCKCVRLCEYQPLRLGSTTEQNCPSPCTYSAKYGLCLSPHINTRECYLDADSLSAGALAGIVIGVVAGVIVIGIVIWLVAGGGAAKAAAGGAAYGANSGGV